MRLFSGAQLSPGWLLPKCCRHLRIHHFFALRHFIARAILRPLIVASCYKRLTEQGMTQFHLTCSAAVGRPEGNWNKSEDNGSH